MEPPCLNFASRICVYVEERMTDVDNITIFTHDSTDARGSQTVKSGEGYKGNQGRQNR
ncbi:hypothetical protein C1H46_038117 [Malus baccata]|uniref:Uncharacterized protein n=1 Tax=Malus baccata TaxID=106549 RepID=A0A540KQ74_MALBA|nr:hypothetical protein C1H46_038117 [Malus baccata]